MKRRVYSGLVTSRPPKEISGSKDNNIEDYILQELSSGKPHIFVPPEDGEIQDRIKELLLYDAALTPAEMPGSYGIPSWALDAARIARARAWAKTKATNVTPQAIKDVEDRINKANAGTPYQNTAARLKAEAMFDNDTRFQTWLLDQVGLKELASWDDVLQAASKLAELAEKNGEATKSRGKPKSGEGEGESEGEGEYQPGEEGKPTARYTKSRSKEGFLDNHSGFSNDPWVKGCTPPITGKRGTWGKLVNVDSPDLLPMRSFRKRGYRRRPEMEGCVPSGWHRLFVDRKLFRGAPMKGGCKGRGTILVDMSGSMSWTYDDFKQLLDTVPECSVYGYSGDVDDACDTGRLVLLADRGRAADMDAVEQWKAKRGLNIVDGPALMFLAHMPAPRVWISDWGVTGIDECRNDYIIKSAREIVEAGNIKNVRLAKDAAKIIYK